VRLGQRQLDGEGVAAKPTSAVATVPAVALVGSGDDPVLHVGDEHSTVRTIRERRHAGDATSPVRRQAGADLDAARDAGLSDAALADIVGTSR
jgi:hypothetical protein